MTYAGTGRYKAILGSGYTLPKEFSTVNAAKAALALMSLAVGTTVTIAQWKHGCWRLRKRGCIAAHRKYYGRSRINWIEVYKFTETGHQLAAMNWPDAINGMLEPGTAALFQKEF